MPFTPDSPSPKNAGDTIRSKDWNDLVTETQRLDNAKVNRSGDAITGSLTIAGSLGVKTTAPKAPLHVVGAGLVSDGDGFAVPNAHMSSGSLTIGSVTANFGGGTGWNANTAGLLLETSSNTEIAVHDSGTRVISVVQYLGASNSLTIGRDMGWGTITSVNINGNLGVGVPAPIYRLDVADRIRLRQGPSGTAGLWLYQTTPNEDRAFVGMNGDNTLGLWGNKGAGWGLNMDVTTGILGVRANPLPNFALTVNATSNAYGLYVYGAGSYGLYVAGNSYTAGRAIDQKIRSSIYNTNQVSTTTTTWADMPNMSLSVTPAIGANFQIQVMINGTQVMGIGNVGAHFRLLIDGVQSDFTRHEFHNNGWELRGITLSRIAYLAAGTHTISVQWYTSGGTLTCCWYGDGRQIMVIEL